MAYVNVKDWSVDQVTDWLKGLDNVILQYNASFLNNGVTGHQLLNLRADDLEHLGVRALGHQEIILEAVEHLRNFHYELDKENLQMLALRLSCSANSLYKELLLVDDDSKMVHTQVMSDVHTIITTIKPLVLWLDRSPFAGNKNYIETKINLLQLSFEMATSAHRDIFSEKPVRTIKEKCEMLARIADHIIQEISDPMILQPASLDLATLKKREQELGFFIVATHQAVHQVADVKVTSAAHGHPKIEEGDEIVQVNYQTIVGWQRKKVMLLLQDSPPEMVLTLKKRPRHTKVFGQIYMKPYRLPSRKRGGDNWSKWNDSLPEPRLMPIIDLPPIRISKKEKIVDDVEASLSSSDSEPPDSPLGLRMYPLKPRPILQRRNTITGATPTSKRPYPSIDQYWDFLKSRNGTTHASSYAIGGAERGAQFDAEDSMFLRDKSASCNVGLDVGGPPRPTTVIGLTAHNRMVSQKKRVNFEETTKKKNFLTAVKNELAVTNLDEEKSVSINSLASLTNEQIGFIDEGHELTDRTNMSNDKVKEIIDNNLLHSQNLETDKENIHTVKLKDPNLAEINKVQGIIKQFETSPAQQAVPQSKPKVLPRTQGGKKPPDVPQKPGGFVKKPEVPPRSATTKLRGRLDKSHSTPAYDLTDDSNEQETTYTGSEQIPLLNKLPDVVPNIPETITESSPVKKEQSDSVFGEEPLELGIPIVEATNVPVIQTVSVNLATTESTSISISTTGLECKILSDMPPKPPPRIFIDVPLKTPVKTPVKKNFEYVSISHSRDSSIELNEEGYLIPKKIPPENEDRHFEPKMVSTPLSKSIKMEFTETDGVSHSSKMNLSHVGGGESKVSPTNSIVKAMMSAKSSSKAGKKKSIIIAKRRKVSVEELSPSDLQGYLFQRLRDKHNQNVHWEKRWFVLLGSSLYGYKNKLDPRAACLIFLSGFTVAVASEVKSRSNAFKVYHTGTVFYFSADDSDTLQTWIELIKTACLHNEISTKNDDPGQYSESDDSDTERSPKPPTTEKSDSFKKFGSLKKFTSKKSSAPSSGSTSLDRKWFFNKPSSHSKHQLPVPTAQFRSYRKIRAEDSCSVRTGNFTSHVAMFSTAPTNLNQSQNVSVPNLTLDTVTNSAKKREDHTLKSDVAKSSSSNVSKQLNFVHASNPSLSHVGGEFAFMGGFKGNNESLAGFVTLEELMNRQNEEEKRNPHHQVEEMRASLRMIKPDVVYGEVPVRTKPKASEDFTFLPQKVPQVPTNHSPSPSSSLSDAQDTTTSSCFGKRLGSLKKNHQKTSDGYRKTNDHQAMKADSDDFDNKMATYPKVNKACSPKSNRSLPRAHRMEGYGGESDYFGNTEMATTTYYSKSSTNLKDRSYEMIYGAETVTNSVQFAQNRTLDDTMSRRSQNAKKLSKVKKQRSISLADDKASSKITRGKKQIGNEGDLKPVHQYTPMTVPLGSLEARAGPKFAFELNLDEKDNKQSRGGKLRQMFGGGKGEKKEKTFLGSPKLHRAIFRRHGSGADLSEWPDSPSSNQTISLSQSSFSLEAALAAPSEVPFPPPLRPHADYPGLKYPPVFEPETYSLANPESSLNILRKRKDIEEEV